MSDRNEAWKDAEIDQLREFLRLKEEAKQSLLRTVKAKDTLITKLADALEAPF